MANADTYKQEELISLPQMAVAGNSFSFFGIALFNYLFLKRKPQSDELFLISHISQNHQLRLVEKHTIQMESIQWGSISKIV